MDTGSGALLVALAIVAVLLVWERLSGNRERAAQRMEAEERIRAMAASTEARESDLFDRLTRALEKPLPPRILPPVQAQQPAWPQEQAPTPWAEPPPPPPGVYPSMALNEDQQELVQRMNAQGKSDQDIWQAVLRMQGQG